jgi:uncharacterized protein YjiS (DUF1127 family)
MKSVLALSLPWFLMRWTMPKWERREQHASLGAEELRAMSDYELKDLGIGRSEVPGFLEDRRPGSR